MFCRNCGTQMEDGASFCPSCGAKVEAENANQTPNGGQQAQYNPEHSLLTVSLPTAVSPEHSLLTVSSPLPPHLKDKMTVTLPLRYCSAL